MKRMGLLLLCFGLFVRIAGAQTNDVVSEGSACETLLEPSEGPVDKWYAWVSDRIAAPFDRVDRLFGDDIPLDEVQRTRLKTAFGVRFDRDNTAKMLTDFSLRMALPRIEARWQVFLDQLESEDDLESVSDLKNPPIDTEPDVGLRYYLRQTGKKSLSADAGYRFGNPNQAFGRLRLRLRYAVACFLVDATQTGTYFTEEGWRSQTDFGWTLPFAQAYGFRSFTRATVEDISEGYAIEQQFSVYRLLTVRRAWRVQVSGNWPTLPDPEETRYVCDFTYRQLIHRKWLFMEITPGVEFKQDRDYDPNPFIALKLEIVFNAD